MVVGGEGGAKEREAVLTAPSIGYTATTDLHSLQLELIHASYRLIPRRSYSSFDGFEVVLWDGGSRGDC